MVTSVCLNNINSKNRLCSGLYFEMRNRKCSHTAVYLADGVSDRAPAVGGGTDGKNGSDRSTDGQCVFFL